MKTAKMLAILVLRSEALLRRVVLVLAASQKWKIIYLQVLSVRSIV